jgi:shikimate kinase
MGSGKTTLGARLAARVGADFVDLDDAVEARAGTSIVEIFATRGEAAFRALELETLAALAASPPARCVVAAGGGIVETTAAHALLHQLGSIVWLRADPAACVLRLSSGRAARPLLAPGADWRVRWEQRAPLYRALADHIVSTHPDDPESSLTALAALWQG